MNRTLGSAARRPLPWLSLMLALCPTIALSADVEPTFTRTIDAVYGRKFGTALTLDVFKPKKDANGLGLIWVVSGGWFSSARRDQPRAREGQAVSRPRLHGVSPSSTAASRSSPSPKWSPI